MPAVVPELELQELGRMDRIRRFFAQEQHYEPLENGNLRDSEGSIREDISQESSVGGPEDNAFSWIEYGIFCLLGIAMLWAWNMFLAAAPYFHDRFETSKWIRDNFQSAQISVSTVANLGSMLILQKMQKNASYPKRILSSLTINIICFTLLAISTLFRTPAGLYFGFMLLMVFSASIATGLIQNGLFAYAPGFGRSEYTQAIMTGQAVAGVLPCIAQIASAAAASASEASSRSAFAFFLTATTVSVLAFVSFTYLLRRRKDHRQGTIPKSPESIPGEGEYTTAENPPPSRRPVGMLTLFKKLRFLSLAVFLCFAVTMVFPVYTTNILSVNTGGFFAPAIFIPFAFLVWNTGDLIGRLSTLYKTISLTHYPFALFVLSLARLVFIPLYMLCNIRGRGAIIKSDAFYLLVVQLLFGLSNGYLGSECMMGSADWVAEEEKEAAGAFMGLCLVGGLSVGSLLSFFVGGL